MTCDIPMDTNWHWNHDKRIRELEAALESKTTWWLAEKRRAEKAEADLISKDIALQNSRETTRLLKAEVERLRGLCLCGRPAHHPGCHCEICKGGGRDGAFIHTGPGFPKKWIWSGGGRESGEVIHPEGESGTVSPPKGRTASAAANPAVHRHEWTDQAPFICQVCGLVQQ